jgi:hypothetical protein
LSPCLSGIIASYMVVEMMFMYLFSPWTAFFGHKCHAMLGAPRAPVIRLNLHCGVKDAQDNKEGDVVDTFVGHLLLVVFHLIFLQ